MQQLLSYLIFSFIVIGAVPASFAAAKKNKCVAIFSSAQTSIPLADILGTEVTTFEYSMEKHHTALGLRIDAIFKPADNVGYLFSIKLIKPETPIRYLWKAVIDRPKYFARFDMFADNNQLIMPDAVRLSAKNAGRIQFADIPANKSQLFSNEEFEAGISMRTLLLGSTETYFEHDRLQEHLMGALATSNYTIKKIIKFIQFRRSFEKMGNSTDPKTLAGNRIRHLTDTSALWDLLSNSMGQAVLAVAGTEGPITAAQISLVRDVITKTDMDFSVETDVDLNYASVETIQKRRRPITSQMAADIANSEFPKKKKSELIAEIRKLELQYLTVPMSEDQIMDETYRIIHEITEVPVAELRKLWELSPKDFSHFI